MGEQGKTTREFTTQMGPKGTYAVGVNLFSQGNDVAAAHWIEQSAQQGLPQAQAHIGNMYLQGLGVGRDAAKALAYLNQAAEQGEPRALGDLGVLYANGDGVEQDLSTAADYFIRSLEKGGGQHAKEYLRDLRALLLEGADEIPENAHEIVARIDLCLSRGGSREPKAKAPVL